MSDLTSIGAGDSDDLAAPRHRHVCPVWIGRLMVSPLRRLFEDPASILRPLVAPGATVVDVGCGMGFHALDLARLVGPEGRVICLDIQPEMLDNLVKRAARAGLEGIVEPRPCTQEALGIDDLAGGVDLLTAFNVIHETGSPTHVLGECTTSLASEGRMLISEPRGHVSRSEFAETVAIAQGFGLVLLDAPKIRMSRTALFGSPSITDGLRAERRGKLGG